MLVIVSNEFIQHTNLLCERQHGVTNMVPGVTGHWIGPCKVLFCGERLNARVPVERQKCLPNISVIRVKTIMEPLVIQPIMAGSEALPSQGEVILPHSLLGSRL